MGHIEVVRNQNLGLPKNSLTDQRTPNIICGVLTPGSSIQRAILRGKDFSSSFRLSFIDVAVPPMRLASARISFPLYSAPLFAPWSSIWKICTMHSIFQFHLLCEIFTSPVPISPQVASWQNIRKRNL